MAGTRIGGLLSYEKNIAQDPQFYVKIGRIGGLKGKTGGFYANRELASAAGRVGGFISRRGSGRRSRLLTYDDRQKRYKTIERARVHLQAIQDKAAHKRYNTEYI